jgi:hypothetical protein
LWLVFGREGSLDNGSVKAKDAAQSSLRVGYAQLLLSPTILACWAAAFGANWSLSLALSWQGAYLIKGLGLAQSSIGFLGALGAGGSAVAMLATGWYSQRLLSRGVSSRLARGILGGLSVVLGGAALAMLPYLPGIPVKIALTTLGVALPSVIYVISNAVVAEITPAARATRASGVISRSGHHMVQDSWDIVVIDEAGLPYSRLNISSITALAAAAPISFLTSPQRPKLVPHAGQMTRVSSLVDSTGAGIAWPHLVHLSVASASLMFASLA